MTLTPYACHDVLDVSGHVFDVPVFTVKGPYRSGTQGTESSVCVVRRREGRNPGPSLSSFN